MRMQPCEVQLITMRRTTRFELKEHSNKTLLKKHRVRIVLAKFTCVIKTHGDASRLGSNFCKNQSSPVHDRLSLLKVRVPQRLSLDVHRACSMNSSQKTSLLDPLPTTTTERIPVPTIQDQLWSKKWDRNDPTHSWPRVSLLRGPVFFSQPEMNEFVNNGPKKEFANRRRKSQ